MIVLLWCQIFLSDTNRDYSFGMNPTISQMVTSDSTTKKVDSAKKPILKSNNPKNPIHSSHFLANPSHFKY